MIQIYGDCWDDPWGNGDPLYPAPEGDPVAGVPATPKPPDRPGGHYEQLPNGGWMWVPDAPTGSTGGGGSIAVGTRSGDAVWNGSEWVIDKSGDYFHGPEGGGGGGGSSRPGFSGAPFSFNPGPAPMFDAPTFERRADFAAPSFESIGSDPGYQFRKQQGEGALAAKYASLGNLATGGAKKGFIDYNQALASQEYDQVYNRALGTYKTNFEGDLNAYDRLFQEKDAEYKPKFLEWQTLAQLGQRGAELNFNRDWDQFTFGEDDAFRREESNRKLLEILFGSGG